MQPWNAWMQERKRAPLDQMTLYCWKQVEGMTAWLEKPCSHRISSCCQKEHNLVISKLPFADEPVDSENGVFGIHEEFDHAGGAEPSAEASGRRLFADMAAPPSTIPVPSRRSKFEENGDATNVDRTTDIHGLQRHSMPQTMCQFGSMVTHTDPRQEAEARALFGQPGAFDVGRSFDAPTADSKLVAAS